MQKMASAPRSPKKGRYEFGFGEDWNRPLVCPLSCPPAYSAFFDMFVCVIIALVLLERHLTTVTVFSLQESFARAPSGGPLSTTSDVFSSTMVCQLATALQELGEVDFENRHQQNQAGVNYNSEAILDTHWSWLLLISFRGVLTFANSMNAESV